MAKVCLQAVYMVYHKGYHSGYDFIALVLIWVFHQVASMAKRLVMKFQCYSIVLRRKVAVTFLEQEVLRVCKHIVPSSRITEPNRVP
jgi:hypothetical protein